MSWQSETNKEVNFFVFQYVKVVVIILVLGALVTGIGWLLWPVQKKVEREVMVNSHQYQEARTEAQIQLEQEIARLNTEIAKTDDPEVKQALEGQKAVLENRMKREKAKER